MGAENSGPAPDDAGLPAAAGASVVSQGLRAAGAVAVVERREF